MTFMSTWKKNFTLWTSFFVFWWQKRILWNFTTFFQMKTKKKNDSICIQKKYQIIIKATKIFFSRTKKIFETEIIIELSIKATKILSSRKRQIDVYITVVFILKKIKKKNIEIYYKSLTEKNYFFQSLKKIDFVLNVCYDDFNVIITADCIVIFITNLKISSVKIRKNELINYVMTHENFKSAENVNFDYKNVFFWQTCEIKKNWQFFRNSSFRVRHYVKIEHKRLLKNRFSN